MECYKHINWKKNTAAKAKMIEFPKCHVEQEKLGKQDSDPIHASFKEFQT